MVKVLIESLSECKKSETQILIDKCKSNSSVVGRELREAHRKLGENLAKSFFCEKETFAVICFMRAGLPFSEGIADFLDCQMFFYDSKNDKNFFETYKEYFKNKTLILSDSVINSGKEILSSFDKIKDVAKKVIVVTNVINENCLENFVDKELFTVRISKNSFRGGKVLTQKDGVGPDTGDRLFRTL